ncbi:MAG: hypothetical protein J4G15_12375 [Alphaproteobacteria bacterium]|nr:hypothetical protein [Alphaproteobacteria bacterium]
MVLAACEAYEFGNNNDRKPVETYAHVWGYRRLDLDRKTEHIFVDRFNSCVSADGSPDGVELGVDVVDLQNSIVRYWSPQVSLLGDFHTHPFRSLKKLRRSCGWEFSEGDDKSFRKDRHLWKHADQSPITIVMAIAPLDKARSRKAKRKAADRWRFDVGKYRFHIKVAVGRMDRSGKRRVTRKNLTLNLGWRF